MGPALANRRCPWRLNRWKRFLLAHSCEATHRRGHCWGLGKKKPFQASSERQASALQLEWGHFFGTPKKVETITYRYATMVFDSACLCSLRVLQNSMYLYPAFNHESPTGCFQSWKSITTCDCQSGLIHGQNIETNSPYKTNRLQLIPGFAFLSCTASYLHTIKIDGLFWVSHVVLSDVAKLHYAVPFHLSLSVIQP